MLKYSQYELISRFPIPNRAIDLKMGSGTCSLAIPIYNNSGAIINTYSNAIFIGINNPYYC